MDTFYAPVGALGHVPAIDFAPLLRAFGCRQNTNDTVLSCEP